MKTQVYEYLFCYWSLDPKTLERKSYNKITIYANNCISAVKQFELTRHIDLIEYMKNVDLDNTVEVTKDRFGSYIFSPYFKPLKPLNKNL